MTKAKGRVAASAVTSAIIALGLLAPPTVSADNTLYAAAVYTSDGQSSWLYNYPTQTKLILAIQESGWDGYQTFSSGQCAATVYWRARAGTGSRSQSVVAGLGNTEDQATTAALNAARRINLGQVDTQLLGTYCQG